MIVITGGCGFIGSNLVKALNSAGRSDLLVVDDLRDGTKIVNLADCDIADYLDKDDYLEAVQAKRFGKPDAIVHLGACSDTTEWDGVFMMKNNYEYSRELLGYCLGERVPFIYASSASVYGHGRTFKEDRQFEEPANLYAYSKFLFDQHVRRVLPEAQSQVAGLRYFNVYGPRERHKGRMASVALHFHDQVRDTGAAKLFGEYDNCKAGEHRRDFVHVDDTVAVKLWLLENPGISGIFNVGTGQASTYNAMARAVIKNRGFGEIAYVPFPEDLKGRYQSFTEADLSELRAAGFDGTFRDVEQGVDEYMSWLAADTR